MTCFVIEKKTDISNVKKNKLQYLIDQSVNSARHMPANSRIAGFRLSVNESSR